MAYDTLQRSRSEGRPVELYDFYLAGRVLRLTNAAYKIEFGGLVYRPVPITRTRLVLQPQTDRQDITITVPFTESPAREILLEPDMPRVLVTVWGMHFGDSERKEIFRARLVGFRVRLANGVADITVRTGKQQLSRAKINRMFRTRYCPYMVYSDECGVSSAAFRKDLIAVGASGPTVNLPTGWAAPLTPADYTFGAFAWEFYPGVSVTAWILNATDTAIVIDREYNIAPGDTIRVYPACDKTPETCQNRFNNIARYGGMLGRPPLPGDSPFIAEG